MPHDQPILVIDDNVNLARGFAAGLQRNGYRVNVAHTAQHGRKLADADHPALIVVDFRMPFINGAGFLYRLRACPKYKNTPVLVVTGATVDDEMRAELADLNAVLRFKPLALADLLNDVAALLGETTSASLAADRSHASGLA
jgi:DNA-binding response OmpR family regulator